MSGNNFNVGSNPYGSGWNTNVDGGSSTPSSHSSSGSSTGSVSSADAAYQYVAYGVLPMSVSSGITLVPGDQATFRFRAQGSQANLFLLQPNGTPVLQALTAGGVTNLTFANGQQLARIEWPTGNTSAMPVIVRNGVRKQAGDWLQLVRGSRLRSMPIAGSAFYIAYDSTGFYIYYENDLTRPPVGSIRNVAGVCEIRVVPGAVGGTNMGEVLNSITIAAIVLQGRHCVAL